jgi:hypothetical protein
MHQARIHRVRLKPAGAVWESLETLKQFVYRSAHVGPLRDRRQWFESIDGPMLALWWIPAGHIPAVAEAVLPDFPGISVRTRRPPR